MSSFRPSTSSLVQKMPLRRFDCAAESNQSSVSSFRRRPESRGVGRGECSAVEDFARRGACPPLGSGGAWQNPPCQLAVPSHNSSFSYLHVPTPAGTSDCNENVSRTPIRDVPSNQPRCRLSPGESCRVVDQRSMAESENVVRSKTTRGEGLVPRLGRVGRGRIRRANSPYQATTPASHSLVCRPQPARAIAMKTCPGLRSGMCPPINLDAGSPPANPAES